jgi:predicted ATPase
VPSERIEFDNPTFLVGQNGSGKSNIADAFAFLADAMASPLQAVFDRRGGISAVRNRTSGRSYPPNLGLAVVFGPLNGDVLSARYGFEIRALPNYGFEVLREQCLAECAEGKRFWFDRRRQDLHTNVPGLAPALDAALLALPVVGGQPNLTPVLRTLAALRVYSIEPAKVGEMQDPDSGVSLRPDGSNVASVLQEIERHSPDDLKRVCEILGTIVPSTTRVKPAKHGNKLSLEFTQEWGQKKRLKFEAFNMSDGALRAIGLLTAVYQRPTPSLIAVEEPEATIHPGALGAVLDLLQHASRLMQVVVTTHSPELLDAECIEDRHLRIVTWHEGATRITPISDASRKALQQHLAGAGELLRSNALHAPPYSSKTQTRVGSSRNWDEDSADRRRLWRGRGGTGLAAEASRRSGGVRH